MGIGQKSAGQQGFEELLKESAGEIDAVLGRLLPPQEVLVDAMRYALLGQGKRLRPFLVTESARLFGVPRERALRAGAALECMHCYSLIHDDLPAMDDDDLRRGKPTVHKAYDEATAILAGDALQTLSFEILSGPQTHPDAAIRVELIGALARAAGKDGMAGGQMLDLNAGVRKPGLDDVMRMQAMKTGALFRFACEGGAILGRASPEERAALRRYADGIGLAFQIVDDILDVESSPEKLGKATQKDKHAGKVTYVDLFGLEGAKLRARDLSGDANQALERFGKGARILRDLANFIIARQA